jgi:ATP-dependent phosphoenolpyruvate carboxykinase
MLLITYKKEGVKKFVLVPNKLYSNAYTYTDKLLKHRQYFWTYINSYCHSPIQDYKLKTRKMKISP